MKTQFNVIAVVCTLLILATSCKKEKQGIQLTQNAITDKIPVEVKEYFASIGFDSATLALQNGKYVIEGDIAFTAARVQERIKKGQSSARHSYESIIANEAAANIRVVVGGNLRNDPDWMAAIKVALRKWNVVSNCRINFLLDPNRLPGSGWEDVVITDGVLPGLIVGLGTFPDENVGNLVTIDMVKAAFMDFKQRTFLIMHEIGHNVGLRHTDQPYPANEIPGTPEEGDPESIMNSGVDGNNQENDQFSTYDLVAIRFLYPVTPNSVLTTSVYGNSVLQQGTSYYQHGSTAAYGCNNISWQLLDANQNLIRNLSSEDEDYDCDEIVWFSNNLPSGNYYLKCTVTGGGYNAVPALYPIVVQ